MKQNDLMKVRVKMQSDLKDVRNVVKYCDSQENCLNCKYMRRTTNDYICTAPDVFGKEYYKAIQELKGYDE